jgi:protein archease
MQPRFGFREKAHTADWELEVWAPDLACLLEQAARGMYALSGMRFKPGEVQTRMVSLHAADAEGLLVRFLTELLWLAEQQGLGFETFSIQLDSHFNLKAELRGYAIASVDKEIKAVTYHNLQVQDTAQGLRVLIVFDV